jgi:hypothetical protein
MTAIYLAARYSRHPQMREARDVLARMGHTVTSRWIDQHGGDQLESATLAQLNINPAACSIYGIHDVEDVTAADVVVSFTGGEGGKGGRHVEFGLGIALGKDLVVIGPREHIFHTLPQVRQYETWPDFVRLDEVCRIGVRTAWPRQ